MAGMRAESHPFGLHPAMDSRNWQMTVFRLHLPVTMFVFGVVVVVLFLFAVPYSIPRDLYTMSRVVSHVLLTSFLICPPSSTAYVLHQSHHRINEYIHMRNMTCQRQEANSRLHSGVPTRYTPEAEAAGHSLVDQAGHFASKMAVILRVFS